ncbi:M20 family metallopeptidase [Halanaerobium sp. Z-7514]|uniref:M20 family metallopeptidase n=1 Tax=Halanaerobium polyolivorans TaxID=2886943 RepID=A0AAW4X0F8_9FIRM|nr:M20 family metallopeptidase [Halanaerobium polyolivorans]MCC3145291.1 M20 family metallopeptidase [Halanaerobium polyolivorans]
MDKIKELAEKHFAYAVEMRREFHMHPEASMQEERTSARVAEELEKLGLATEIVAGTGVVATIEGKKGDKTIALRADMDALELEEENDLEYKSQNDGLMHGCGHDGHTASLLTAAKIINELKEEFSGKVKLLFQPGEEVAEGAKAMVEAGVLADVDSVMGIHLWNELQTGKVSLEAGPRMAAVNLFKIDVKGKGGHGSMPQQGVDALTAGAAVVMNLQSIVSREISPLDPSVLSVGIFKSGSRFNVLPGKAYLEGTTRCFSKELNDKFPQMIERVASETAQGYRASIEMEYNKLTLPCINDEEMTEIGQKSVVDLFGEESLAHVEKTTGGEDFSFYTAELPGVFAFVGSKNEDKVEYHPHHHPKFNIDEAALKVSAALYAKFALDFLKA